MARERCLRDRNSQLLAPGKSFKRVLDVLAAVQVAHLLLPETQCSAWFMI